MSSRVILISGANTGLGLETVKSIYNTSSQASTIFVCGRSVKSAQDAIDGLKKDNTSSEHSLVALQLDVTDDKSIEAAFNKVSTDYGKLDVLINNAGAGFDAQIANKNMSIREAWNASWDVNVSGAVVMTHTFVPLLLKSSDPRLLFITSGTSSLTETVNANLHGINTIPAAGWPKDAGAQRVFSYSSSKTGLNMMMRGWARLLKEDGVKVFCISPGFLATGLGGIGVEALKKMGAGDVSIGGNFIKDVVDGKRDAEAGVIIRVDSQQPW